MAHTLHVTYPKTGWFAPVTTVNHDLGWLLRQLDHQPAVQRGASTH